jgi:hypothetical protein
VDQLASQLRHVTCKEKDWKYFSRFAVNCHRVSLEFGVRRDDLDPTAARAQPHFPPMECHEIPFVLT